MAKRKTKADLEKEILTLNKAIRSLLGCNGYEEQISTELTYKIIYSLEDVMWSGEYCFEKDGITKFINLM